MSDDLLDELLAAREARRPCVLATLAATSGSVPRAAGAKMLVFADGQTSGTIGGGKFESIVVQDCLSVLRVKQTALRKYPLHEADAESFGAICGGEATVLIEPQNLREAIYLVGGGHCAQAIAQLASDAGLFVTVLEDRPEFLHGFSESVRRVSEVAPAEFITQHAWQRDEALVIVSRNPEIDRDALGAALGQSGAGYIGMMGSRRKVRLVYEQLRARGIAEENFERVHAPLGFDIGADSPAEIAISVLAEVFAALRSCKGVSMRSVDAPAAAK